MTIVPRSLVDLLVRLRSRRLRRRLQAQGTGADGQAAAFRARVTALANTEIGRTHRVEARMSYDEFRSRVPLRTTEDFRAFAERMAGGAPDVLVPGRCVLFVYTAGTVDGTPRMLPVPPAMVAHFRTALADAWLLAAQRTGGATLFHGAHVHAGASTALMGAHGVRAGYLDGILRAALSEWSRENLFAPPESVSALPEGADKTAATLAACRGRDVRLLAGTPVALTALLQAARAAGVTWGQLACCVHTGTQLGIAELSLVEAAGAGVALQEIYAAAEGIFAAQDAEAGAGLRLLTDAGVFFEFLPLADLAAGGGDLGAKCVPLARAKVDVDYALVVTTPAGLCRCLVGDVVRLVSQQPPRLVVQGRTPTLLRSFGELVTERELSNALIQVCRRNQWEAVHFHVAPFFTRTVPRAQGCHEWWVELKPGTVRTPTGPVLGAELDAELPHHNATYAARRRSGTLEEPLVRLVMPGVFTRWAELHPTLGGPGKMARCRNDRLMADQLAGIARFHGEKSTSPFP